MGNHGGGLPLEMSADPPFLIPPGAGCGAAGARERGAEEGSGDAGRGTQEGGLTRSHVLLPGTSYGLGLVIPKTLTSSGGPASPQPAGVGEGCALEPGLRAQVFAE